VGDENRGDKVRPNYQRFADGFFLELKTDILVEPLRVLAQRRFWLKVDFTH
jgi:hypothetical protein